MPHSHPYSALSLAILLIGCGAAQTTAPAPDVGKSAAVSASKPQAAPSNAGAPLDGADGTYLPVFTQGDINVICPDPDVKPNAATVSHGVVSFSVRVDPLANSEPDDGPPAVLPVSGTAGPDGIFAAEIPLPAAVVARFKKHKGPMAAATAVRIAGELSQHDDNTLGSGRMLRIFAHGVGVDKAHASACATTFLREDFLLVPHALDSAPAAHKCVPSGGMDLIAENCCSGRAGAGPQGNRCY